jgi:TetR/AcrR family transcriptional repressor of nem operon
MKKSKAETAETRKRILAFAAREFRQHGIDETGLSDLMSAAGLTQGGFYRHFATKAHLVTESIELGIDEVARSFEDAVQRSKGRSAIKAVVCGYLTCDHRDDAGAGCVLAANGSEVARAEEMVRAKATEGIKQLLGILSDNFRHVGSEHARQEAITTLSAMVGAITLARIANGSKLSDEIVISTRRQLAPA